MDHTDVELKGIPNSEFRIPNLPAIGLYIHVPYCVSKCPYCDFYSGRELDTLPMYLDAVCEEITSFRRCSAFVSPAVYERPVCSVYFGGGTPSVLPPEGILRILETARARFTLTQDAEITLEVNPTLPDREAFFAAAAEAGVNRVSVGMQSAVDAERRALGRRGTAADAAATVKAAQAAGISNISLDLMLGIPGQTEQSLQTSLEFALSLSPKHLSVYLLKIEPGTVFEKRRETLDLPDEDAAADLYLSACRFLEEKGMRHYEISNFCFEDLTGAHNLRYWLGGDYIGIGPAAHSCYSGRRFYFGRDTAAFLAGTPPADDGAGGDLDERFLLAMRTDTGVDVSSFFTSPPKKAFFDRAEDYIRLGLMRRQGSVITLTDRGFLVSNTIISALMAGF